MKKQNVRKHPPIYPSILLTGNDDNTVTAVCVTDYSDEAIPAGFPTNLFE